MDTHDPTAGRALHLALGGFLLGLHHLLRLLVAAATATLVLRGSAAQPVPDPSSNE